VFVGAGLLGLDDGKGIEAGTCVTEEHMANMFAAMADPVSGKPVGGVPKAPARAVPVAGFDLTFSPHLFRVRNKGAYAESVIMPRR